MPRMSETTITSMKVKPKHLSQPDYINDARPAPAIEWVHHAPKKRRGESLLKNLAVASALVLCAVTLRTGAVPSLSNATDAVLTAATDHSLLNDQLGKLSFVSALFPEAVLVFGEDHGNDLALPVIGGTIVHAWSEAEPYLSWRTNQEHVTAASDGEVIGMYHGNADERLVQVVSDDGLACLYGNLSEITVQTGEWVSAGDVLGKVIKGQDFVFEVRQDGVSVDPFLYLNK